MASNGVPRMFYATIHVTVINNNNNQVINYQIDNSRQDFDNMGDANVDAFSLAEARAGYIAHWDWFCGGSTGDLGTLRFFGSARDLMIHGFVHER